MGNTTLYEQLLQYARDNGIDVSNLCIGGKLAMTLEHQGEVYIALDLDRMQMDCERSVVLGHELGHAQTGSLGGTVRDYVPEGKREFAADKWAIQYLLPSAALTETLNKNQGRIWEMAEELGVTEDFVRKAMRYYGMER